MFLNCDKNDNRCSTKTIERRVGIMGGTFNPIHNGHLSLAHSALEYLQLDEILFMPSGISWMKKGTDVLESSLRLQMTHLAIENTPKFSLSTIETDRAGNTYTYETLLTLKEQHPDTNYYFIMGADSLFNIEHWKNPAIIMENCVLLVAVRDDYDNIALKKQVLYLQNMYNATIELLSMEPVDISSTEIRNRIKKGKTVKDLIPVKVEQFIKQNNLYL